MGSKISLIKLKAETANLLRVVKALAMDRPIFKSQAQLTKEQWERNYIRELEAEQLRWQYGRPEDIDPELR